MLLVHRPGHGDWSLPKGKCEPGEDDLACALREVEEETGLRCEPGEELPSTSYVDGKGRAKLVRYWAMTPIEGSFAAGEEVDEVRWLALEDAAHLLSYARDAAVVYGLRYFG